MRELDQSVHTGNTILLKIDGKIVGRAQGVDARRSFGTQPVHELGSIMPKEHVHTQYEGSLTLERYFVRNKALRDLGLEALGEEVLKKGLINIEIIDKSTSKTVRVYYGCTVQDTSETFRTGQISGENSTWVYLSAGDGSETSSLNSTTANVSGGLINGTINF